MEEKNINVKKLRIPELIDFSFKGQDDKPFVMAIKKIFKRMRIIFTTART